MQSNQKPVRDGKYLRLFDEGEAFSWWRNGTWNTGDFWDIKSDLQDVAWRGAVKKITPRARKGGRKTADAPGAMKISALHRPVINDFLRDQAVKIADEEMVELLRAHAVGLDDIETRFGMVDEDSVEVFSLSKAEPAIRGAFEWLSARGLARLERDSRGDVIVLVSLPTSH